MQQSSYLQSQTTCDVKHCDRNVIYIISSNPHNSLKTRYYIIYTFVSSDSEKN